MQLVLGSIRPARSRSESRIFHQSQRDCAL